MRVESPAAARYHAARCSLALRVLQLLHRLCHVPSWALGRSWASSLTVFPLSLSPSGLALPLRIIADTGDSLAVSSARLWPEIRCGCGCGSRLRLWRGLGRRCHGTLGQNGACVNNCQQSATLSLSLVLSFSSFSPLSLSSLCFLRKGSQAHTARSEEDDQRCTRLQQALGPAAAKRKDKSERNGKRRDAAEDAVFRKLVGTLIFGAFFVSDSYIFFLSLFFLLLSLFLSRNLFPSLSFSLLFSLPFGCFPTAVDSNRMALVALRMAARAVKPHSALPAAAIARQRQHLSSESAGKKTDAQVELYESPLARPVRTLKTVSVTSASLTMVFLPAVGLELFSNSPFFSGQGAKEQYETEYVWHAGAELQEKRAKNGEKEQITLQERQERLS